MIGKIRNVKPLFPVLAGPVAAGTLFMVTLLVQRPLIYHQPWGIYYFALFPTLVLSIIYWIGYVGIVLRSGTRVSTTVTFIHSYLYHLISLPLCMMLFNQNEKAGVSAAVVLSIIFNAALYVKYINAQVEVWVNRYGRLFIAIFALLAVIVPAMAVLYIAYFVPEPPTPFELRGQMMPCQTDSDCVLFDCSGYNVGAWYCDSDGTPRCNFDAQMCGCHVGCL